MVLQRVSMNNHTAATYIVYVNSYVACVEQTFGMHWSVSMSLLC